MEKFTVRTLVDDEDVDKFIALREEVFGAHEKSEGTLIMAGTDGDELTRLRQFHRANVNLDKGWRTWKASTERDHLNPRILRGWFDKGTGKLAGEIAVYIRRVRFSSRIVNCGLVASVIVSPEYRKYKLGRSMMEDIENVCRQEETDMIVLKGIPDFYLRLGYTTIVDLTCSNIGSFDIKRLKLRGAKGLRIRKAESADAEKLLALRTAEFSQYHGYHEWTLEQYKKQIEDNQKADDAKGRDTWLLAEDEEATPMGYMILHDTLPHAAVEIVATSSEAATEFLKYHSAIETEQTASEPLIWAMPESSNTYYYVRSLVPLLTKTYSWDSGAWQAKVTAGRWSSLLETLWPTSNPDTPAIDLTIVADTESESSAVYRIGPTDAQEVTKVTLSEPVFMKLLWGYIPSHGPGTGSHPAQLDDIARLLNAVTKGERAKGWITGRDHI